MKVPGFAMGLLVVLFAVRYMVWFNGNLLVLS